MEGVMEREGGRWVEGGGKEGGGKGMVMYICRTYNSTFKF